MEYSTLWQCKSHFCAWHTCCHVNGKSCCSELRDAHPFSISVWFCRVVLLKQMPWGGKFRKMLPVRISLGHRPDRTSCIYSDNALRVVAKLPDSWDTKIWSFIPHDPEARMAVLARPSSNSPDTTRSVPSCIQKYICTRHEILDRGVYPDVASSYREVWAVLPTFLKYMLPPSSGSKCNRSS
jgi:hypothetical protein